MKKILSTFIIICMLAASLLSLSACSDKYEDYAGVYDCIYVDTGNYYGYSPSQYYSIELKPNGKAIIRYSNIYNYIYNYIQDELHFSYDINAKKQEFTERHGMNRKTHKIIDDIIIFEQIIEGITVTFYFQREAKFIIEPYNWYSWHTTSQQKAWSIAGLTPKGMLIEHLIIPESIAGITVTNIQQYAFNNNLNIKSVHLPANISAIEYYAFAYTQRLETVTFAQGSILKKIDGDAFFMSGIKSIKIPDTVTYIGFGAFGRCSNLASINIPFSVTEIRGNAFFDWTSNQTIYVEGRTAAPYGWFLDYYNPWNHNCNATIVYLG